jgi:hypothetical protein
MRGRSWFGLIGTRLLGRFGHGVQGAWEMGEMGGRDEK